MSSEKTINLIEASIKKMIEEMRPPAHIRDDLDIGYSFQNNTLELFEIRPIWDNMKEKIQSPFSKTKYIKSKGIWRIYWMRASGKWELYEPDPEVKDISDFFVIVKEDKHACFFG